MVGAFMSATSELPPEA